MAPEVRREVVMERSAVSCWVEIGWVIVGIHVERNCCEGLLNSSRMF